MGRQKRPIPQFKRLLNVRSENVADALSVLAADGYPEWTINSDEEEFREHTEYDMSEGPGRFKKVRVTRTRIVSYTVMGWYERSESDEDSDL